ncbi:MAG TPA: hypothetical protein VN880_18435 [Solirubrobacteraceae bacterium]|jgi:hypothetical protein|nr:hypothetical protein [Solirubrobacteraceae bacterium]
MVEQTRTRSLTATRTLGALALLVIGGVHYQQYHYAFYSSIPTIGPLFVLNFISATALGLFLIVPVRSWLGRRGKLLDQLAALAGIGVATGGLVALLISEQTPLFGFMEHGYRFVIVLTIASDAVAIAMLTLFLSRVRTEPGSPGARASQTNRSDAPPTSESIGPGPVAPAAEP